MLSTAICRIAATGLVTGLMAGAVNAQTLEDALVKAYQGNPTLKSERARLRATDEGVPQALSGWRPTVEVSGSYGWARSNSTTTAADKVGEVREPLTGSLTISQSLYRGGRTVAATDQAENNVKADRARLADAEQTVLISVVTAYADVVRNQAEIELNISNERVLQRQLEATGDRFRVGEVTRTDVSQAESRLARARADRIASEGSLTDARAAYENAVGEVPTLLKPAKPLDQLPGSLSDAIELAKRNNFAVSRARSIERAAQNSVRSVVGELLPNLSLNGELESNRETANDRNESEDVSLIARVTMPLYASGSVTSRVRAAKQVVSQRREESNQAVRTAVEAATDAWQTVQTGRAQIRAFSAAVKAAEIALEGVREEANVGSRTVLDVLDAEQELLDARVGLVRAMRDELVATYQLRQAVGEATAQKLGLPVALYNVEKHYREVRGKWWGLGASDGK
ncbi:MAG: outer membrane protein [Paracoccaceae bacterium]|jgi:outer membrane protein